MSKLCTYKTLFIALLRLEQVSKLSLCSTFLREWADYLFVVGTEGTEAGFHNELYESSLLLSLLVRHRCW